MYSYFDLQTHTQAHTYLFGAVWVCHHCTTEVSRLLSMDYHNKRLDFLVGLPLFHSNGEEAENSWNRRFKCIVIWKQELLWAFTVAAFTASMSKREGSTYTLICRDHSSWPLVALVACSHYISLVFIMLGFFTETQCISKVEMMRARFQCQTSIPTLGLAEKVEQWIPPSPLMR
jgi:hypothetical protein